jgi:hypothetical protein
VTNGRLNVWIVTTNITRQALLITEPVLVATGRRRRRRRRIYSYSMIL